MRKLTDFIIEKRYFVLIFFIILSVIAGIYSQKVVINYDLTKYLPNTSETRIGLDIMEEKIDSPDSSSFNLMFKGLEKDEKLKIEEYLENVNHVSSVDYDDTEEYNKNENTLYDINVDADKDSRNSYRCL